MRKLLMAGAIALWPGIAHAQIPTIDAAALIKLGEQLIEMKQTYEATMGVLGSLVPQLDPNAIVGSLGNALPGAGDIGRTITGQGSLGGLSGLLGGYRDRNTYYRPEGSDFAATQMDRMGNTWGGTQAMAEAQMQSIAARMDSIQALQDRLSTATTEADLSAVRGRLDAEKAMLQAETAQAQSIQNLAVAQREQYQLMEMQRSRESADALYRAADQARRGAAAPVGLAADRQFPTFQDFGS